jgi:prepilin-type N-terminal cleavage/methylation domain-containing protein
MSKIARKRTGNARAFTLVETMVVVALFAVIGVSLLQSLTMGMKIWKKATQTNFVYRKSLLGMERLAQDLRQTLDYPAIGFFGDKERLDFAALLREKITNVSYIFNPQEKAVFRSGISRQEALGLAEAKAAPREVMAGVKELTFVYYGFDPLANNFTFQEAWNSTKSGVPLAVKTTATLESGEIFEKTIAIPISQ